MKFGLKALFLSAVSAILIVASVPVAQASTPFLTATSQGGSVQVTVNSADAYSRVNLSYQSQGTTLWTVISNIGTTDQSGYFSQNVNVGYNSSQSMSMYVTVNGQQSPTVTVNSNGGGCGINGCSAGLSLSPSTLSLNIGQTSTVSVYGNNGSAAYVSNNSNSSVATASVNSSNNSISVYGNSYGTTTMNVCGGNSGSCAILYVTVGNNGGGTGAISFSQNNVNLNIGQSMSVNVYNSSYNSLYIASNSNSGVVSANLSGNTINLYGSTTGSTIISVCGYGSINQCGTLYVTVGNGNGGGYGQITFSQTNVNLSLAQSTNVTIYNSYVPGSYGGVTNNYYVASNSNSGVVSASISGNSVYVYGNSNGSATISICTQSGGTQCGSLYVTVGNGGYGGQQITFSQNNLNLNFGQSNTVTIYGGSGSGYFLSSGSNSSVVTTAISLNQITLYAVNSGSATLNICSSNTTSQCGSLYVTVGNGGGYGGQLSFSQNNVSLSYGQSMNVTVFGGNGGSFYVSSNSNSGAVSASISGSTVYLYANTNGSATISICSSNYGSQCGTLYVTVGNGNGGGYGQVAFSINNLTLNQGQSSSITLSGGSGSYYVSSNANSSIVTANVSGNSLNLYGNSAGSTSMSVCSYSGTQCGTLYVTVGNGNGGGYGGVLSFSQPNVNLNLAQSLGVSIYGGTYSSYYISSNTNSSVVSASVSGSTINLYGNSAGTASISVCASGYSSQCGSLYVTVGASTSGGSNVSITDDLFTPRTITVSAGTNVAWRNNGSMVHTVTADNGAFNSGNITPGSSYNFTFNTPGTYAYHCIFHGSAGGIGMSGTVVVTGSGSGGGVLGVSTYPNGTLFNVNGGQAIYIVYRNTQTGFGNFAAFTGLGFRVANMITVSSGLPDSGYVINAANAAHPWGSWVKSGNTIYFVHEAGLIPISSFDIFLSNGGNINLVVPANAFDLSLPRLSIMAPGDPRLQ